MQLIGWGHPSPFRPKIPEYLILQEGDKRFRLEKDRSLTEITTQDISDHVEILSGPFEYQTDSDTWVCIESHTISWYEITDETNWRKTRAATLIESLDDIQGPIQKLQTIKALGELLSINIAELSSYIFGSQKPGESLSDVISRLKSDAP